jgi:hypothetical protein
MTVQSDLGFPPGRKKPGSGPINRAVAAETGKALQSAVAGIVLLRISAAGVEAEKH